MNRQPVNSSMIRAWAFDAAGGVLEIEFTNGRVYEYADVPEFLAKGFELASSKGHFFLTRIDNRFKAEEIEREAPSIRFGAHGDRTSNGNDSQ